MLAEVKNNSWLYLIYFCTLNSILLTQRKTSSKTRCRSIVWDLWIAKTLPWRLRIAN